MKINSKTLTRLMSMLLLIAFCFSFMTTIATATETSDVPVAETDKKGLTSEEKGKTNKKTIKFALGHQDAKISYTIEPDKAYTSTALAEAALDEYEIAEPGGEKYWGDWYGFDERVEWCAIFVSYCADQAGLLDAGLIKLSALAHPAKYGLEDRQLELGVTPKPGYIVFFNTDDNPEDVDHVGIVVNVNENTKVVTVVEGNWEDRVQRTEFNYQTGKAITYKGWSRIMCYCVPESLGYSVEEIAEKLKGLLTLTVHGEQQPDDIMAESKYRQRSKDIVVRVKDVVSYLEVKAKVWTTKNGEDDAELITLTQSADDGSVYTGRFFAENHNSENGEYQIEVMLYNEDGNPIDIASAHASVYMYPTWDIDGNGSIAQNDVDALMNYIAMPTTETQELTIAQVITKMLQSKHAIFSTEYRQEYDINEDGAVNMYDVLLLQTYVNKTL